MKKSLPFFAFLFLICQISIAQSPIFDLNKELSRGINMGNMFEAPTETAWGNPFQDDYFERIADLGFNHVRIPIRWDTPERTQQTAPYTINATFLARIKNVIDKALEEELYVIINMHHHEAIFENPDQVKPRFLSLWQQIATYFKDYDNRLVFEVMNEPNSNLTPEKWNVFFADALQEIRSVSETRAVLMGIANWGGLGSVSSLQIPQDGNIILTVHYYQPFNFTHQGAEWVDGSTPWLGTTWDNTNLERDEITIQFQFIKTFAAENNVPIHVGEFGAYSSGDLESRVNWTNYLARWFEENGFSWAYWEFSAGFGIYNPSTNLYLQPLVDALLNDPISDPVIVKTETIFESDFTDNDNEWFLSVQGQGGGTYTKGDGVATINITQNSNDSWHVQFVKTSVSLKQGSTYLVTFEASATENAGFSTYIGKTFGDYSAYTGYRGYTASNDFQEFSYTFTMQDASDPNARIVFDLASTITTFSIKNFVLQEVFPETTTPVFELDSLEITVFPNPAIDEIKVTGIEKFKHFSIFSLNGKELLSGTINQETEKIIRLNRLTAKELVLVLRNDKGFVSRKVIRVK